MSTQVLTRQVPRSEWRAFFDAFSLQHAGWLVSIEVLGREIGAQEEVHEQPLRGIVADRDKDISIIVGEKDAELTRIVDRPEEVWVLETAEGAVNSLEIRSAGEEATLVTFRAVALPENVDGVVG